MSQIMIKNQNNNKILFQDTVFSSTVTTPPTESTQIRGQSM